MRVNELARAVAANIGEGEDPPLAVLPAAIPYFFIRISAICVERRDLDVLQEFVLRAVGLGFSDGSAIAGFLGARSDEIDAELNNLALEMFVSRSAANRTYSLTEKGIAAISQNGLRRVREREAGCQVSGVTRRVEQVSDVLVPKRRVPPGSVILPAVPARPPRLEELDVAGVRGAMLAARSPLPRILEIARLGRIVRTTSLFRGGHLLLRRGTHSVPVICVHGSAETDLARILGGHPALQAIKKTIEDNEKRTRNLMKGLRPKLQSIKLASASLVRLTLTRLVAYADAAREDVGLAKKEFSDAADPLVTMTHWITAAEWHVLLAKAVLDARKRLLVVAPPASPMFELRELETLGELARQGVDVELIIPEDEVPIAERNEQFRGALQGVKLAAQPATAGWCGFCCDEKYLVVGLARNNTSTMGKYDTFFGALVTDVPLLEQLLLDYTRSSDVPIRVKPKRKSVPRHAES